MTHTCKQTLTNSLCPQRCSGIYTSHKSSTHLGKRWQLSQKYNGAEYKWDGRTHTHTQALTYREAALYISEEQLFKQRKTTFWATCCCLICLHCLWAGSCRVCCSAFTLQLQASSDLHTHAPDSPYTEHSVLDGTNTCSSVLEQVLKTAGLQRWMKSLIHYCCFILITIFSANVLFDQENVMCAHVVKYFIN